MGWRIQISRVVAILIIASRVGGTLVRWCAAELGDSVRMPPDSNLARSDIEPSSRFRGVTSGHLQATSCTLLLS